MKRAKYIMLLVAVLSVAFSCRKSNLISGHPDVITVYGTGYLGETPGKFDTLAVIIPDTTVVRGPLDKYFKGFEMLLSPAMSQNGGAIITDVDAPVYILSPSVPVPVGWHEVENSKSNGNTMYTIINGDRIDLCIFETRAYAGRPVSIPVTSTAFCPTPLARKITYVNKNYE